MTERIDHAALAAKYSGGERPTAQVHATLALVEQQRIANLMSYLALIDEAPGPDDNRQIREALGL